MKARNNSVALLSLLHLSDSALPIGAYGHSYGLETLCQNEVLTDCESVFSAIDSLLSMSIAPQEGTSCALAHAYSLGSDFDSFERLNTDLTAGKWAVEARQASLSLGARLLKVCVTSGLIADLDRFTAGDVHYAAAFGWVCGQAEVSQSDCVEAYLYTCCTSMVSACVRLIPLGQTDGQKILARLRTSVHTVSASCLQTEPDAVGSFAPLSEWASVEHESLYTRIFQS